MLDIREVILPSTEQWRAILASFHNSLDSHHRSDSGICKGGDDGIGCENCATRTTCDHAYDKSWRIGKNDYKLMLNMVRVNDPIVSNFRRMITVYIDITAPLSWWTKFDAISEFESISRWEIERPRRILMLNYEILALVYKNCRYIKSDEWKEFISWIEELPYSELITR